jgi:hypothetical protein
MGRFHIICLWWAIKLCLYGISDMWLRSNSAIELRRSSFVTPEAALSSGYMPQSFGPSPIAPWQQGLWLYFNWFLRNAIWYMTVNAYNGQSHHSTLFYSHFCFTYTWSFIENLSKKIQWLEHKCETTTSMIYVFFLGILFLYCIIG